MPIPALLAALAPYAGTAAAGALGGYLGRNSRSLGNLGLGERSARTETLQRFDPQQINALNQLLSQGLSGIQSMQQPFDFSPLEQRARSQFQQQTVPSIAERFTAMGAGSQRSSSFPQLLGQAGAGLEEGLAAQRSQLGLQERGQQQNLLMNLLGLGLQPRTEQFYIPRSPGFVESLLPALGQGVGSGLGYLPLLLSQFGGQ